MKKRLFTSIRSQLWLVIISTILIVLVLWMAFYRTSSGLISKKTSSFVNTLLLQSEDNIRHTADEMIYAANTIASNKTVQQFLLSDVPLERLGYGQTLSNFMMGLMQYGDYVAHINIVGLNSSIISPSQQNIKVIDYLDERYDAFDAEVYRTGFAGKVYNNYDGNSYFTYMRPIYDISSGAKLGTKIGTCVVFCDVNSVNKFLTRSAATENTVFMLLDEDRRIIAANTADAQITEALIASIQPAQNGETSETQELNIDRMRYIVDQRGIEEMGWHLISAVPASEITNDLGPLILLGTITCVLFALLAILWGVQISHSITSPLVAMTQFIDHDLDENLQMRVPITRDNEIGMLCGQFNTMLDKVSDMTNVIIGNQANMYELNLAKKRAELSALQSQINPHFLYNTLDCIKGYGYLLNSEEIVKITNAMSAIMRYCIKGTDFVHLQEELDIVRMYLEIIQIRFEGRIAFEIDIDPAMLELYIPRFILQPIIENAVYHGLEPKLSQGRLRITGRIEERGDFVLCVGDDGVGMSDEGLEHIRVQLQMAETQNALSTQSDGGLALINIHNRIRGTYGPGYGLGIECELGRGMRVTLRMPCRECEGII